MLRRPSAVKVIYTHLKCCFSHPRSVFRLCIVCGVGGDELVINTNWDGSGCIQFVAANKSESLYNIRALDIQREPF